MWFWGGSGGLLVGLNGGNFLQKIGNMLSFIFDLFVTALFFLFFVFLLIRLSLYLYHVKMRMAGEIYLSLLIRTMPTVLRGLGCHVLISLGMILNLSMLSMILHKSYSLTLFLSSSFNSRSFPRVISPPLSLPHALLLSLGILPFSLFVNSPKRPRSSKS
jgi:hypothetical protein